MKVICNRSNECKDTECSHYGQHKPHGECHLLFHCGTVGRQTVKCIEDTASEIKFWLADEEG